MRGNLVSTTAAAGPLASSPNYTSSHAYNDNDDLTQTTDPAGRVYQFFYDSQGRLKATQYPNATYSWSDFNAAGWQTALLNRHGTLTVPLPSSAPIDLSPIADYSYVYNVEGKKTSETRVADGLATETTSYTFDELGRMDTVTLPNA
ncbi:MAG: RHS repeat protein, partial [Actinobacteria bacterium]|nr:RHS repeat protein [Actinomycetota bacterium]